MKKKIAEATARERLGSRRSYLLHLSEWNLRSFLSVAAEGHRRVYCAD
jgi:hypothetical protein